MLYQLSYFRNLLRRLRNFLLRSGQGWVRTTVGVSRQIYSLLRLTTPALALDSDALWHRVEPMGGFEPSTPRLQITCSGRLSYIGMYVNALEKGTAKIGII